MIDRYIIITGLLRLEPVLIKTLKNLLAIREKMNIKSIMFLTWNGELNKIKTNELKMLLKKIRCIQYPKLQDNGGGNHLAQMFHYKKGLELVKYMSKDSKNDVYVLKTRSDLFIDNNSLNEVFSYNYEINDDPILSHKIWLPWVHKTKPFYFEDSIFYSHINSMEKLYNIDTIFKLKKIGQGITHIRRFFTPFLNQEKYKLFNELILDNTDEIMENSHKLSLEKMLNTKTGSHLLKIYYEILNKYFFVSTINENSIIFRPWNQKNKVVNLRYKFDLLYDSKEIENLSKNLQHIF